MLPLTDYLDELVRRQTIAGAVAAVAEVGGVRHCVAAGKSDLHNGRPMLVDDLFWIASLSKPITAVAALMCVAEGSLQLDRPIAGVLSGFPSQSPITLRHVLTHRSGLPFMSPAERATGRIDTLTLADAVRHYAAIPLEFQPGAGELYSNAGFNTAGRLIEQVHGQPFDAWLQERLLDPLGMRDTTFRPDPGRVPTTYAPGSGGGLRPVPISQLSYPLDSPARQASPAGGLFSTAADLCRFGQMVLGGGRLESVRVLPVELCREMTRVQWPSKESEQEGYGLGWRASAVQPGTADDPMAGPVFHGSASQSFLRIDPVAGRVYVLLVQCESFADGSTDDVYAEFVSAADRSC